MRRKVTKFLWKWVKWANLHPKVMRKMSFAGLVFWSIEVIGKVIKHEYDEFFWLFFWLFVLSLVDWVTTSINFQEPKDVGEHDDYDDLR